MRTARAEAQVALAPEAALRLWTDVSRWASFVEGFARVVEQDAGWPAEGSRLIWESIPAGRGRVTEKVIESRARPLRDARLRGSAVGHGSCCAWSRARAARASS